MIDINSQNQIKIGDILYDRLRQEFCLVIETYFCKPPFINKNKKEKHFSLFFIKTETKVRFVSERDFLYLKKLV